MKRTIINNGKTVALLAIMLLVCSAFTKKHTPDETENICLEITGKIGFDNFPEDHSYKVELIHYNTVVKSVLIKDKSIFKFLLKKDAYYTIRISKPGYLTKMVSICTKIVQENQDSVFCKFHFSTKLAEESVAEKLNKYMLDFPIALICFDSKKGQFYNCEKYTAEIKKELHSNNKTNN